MHKLIVMLGFLVALFSTGVLHITITKENSVKTYSTVAAQFAHHVPDSQDCCSTSYLF